MTADNRRFHSLTLNERYGDFATIERLQFSAITFCCLRL
jgi:hypothetical protein